jgi:hypothetical protein
MVVVYAVVLAILVALFWVPYSKSLAQSLSPLENAGLLVIVLVAILVPARLAVRYAVRPVMGLRCPQCGKACLTLAAIDGILKSPEAHRTCKGCGLDFNSK